MRVLRFGALLMLSVLTGCAGHRPHAVSVAAPAPAPATVSQRPLVETPPPAWIPETPLPVLKPGTEVSLAESEALSDQASPKGPPMEGEPTASQKAMGRMAAQTASQPGQASPGQISPGQISPGQASPGQASPAQASGGQPAAGQSLTGEAPASQTASLAPAGGSGPPAVTDAAHLVGLSQSDVTSLFGPPAESKDLPPSKIWTYHSPVCDMKLFFYPEVGGPSFRALTYQIDERGASDATHNACLSSLAKPHAG